MKIKISTPLYSTENSEKIKDVLEEIFPIKFQIKKDKIIGNSKDIKVLSKIREKIQKERIKNTALFLIENNKKDNESKFELNKQTAMIGKVHFVEEEYALGNIVVEFDDSEKVEEYFST